MNRPWVRHTMQAVFVLLAWWMVISTTVFTWWIAQGNMP